MLLSRRATSGSWNLPPLTRFIDYAIRIHRPMDSWDQSSEVADRNKDIVWSKRTASPVHSIPLHAPHAFYIGLTSASNTLFQMSR